MWFEALEQMKLTACKMPHDVSTRWNSTYDLLTFVLQYQAGIDDVTSNKTAGLRQYELSDEEWGIACQLCNSLRVCLLFIVPNLAFVPYMCRQQVFKDATLFFLCSTPNLATVILAMDHIDKMLTTSCLNKIHMPSLCAALSIGKKTLNRYYNTTDQSEVYQIAMSEFMSIICIFVY
jgi:hypothetical protein